MINQHPIQVILGDDGLTLADIGASYFLPDTWQLLAGLKSTSFILVDPNGSNLGYSRAYSQPKFITLPYALSGDGGVKTLYLSNTDSGSSLYPPVNRAWERKIDNDYFFPMKLIDIETITLERALNDTQIKYIDAIKLDTQGSELEILMGLDVARWESLLFVELEVSLQNPPAYEGAARVNEVQKVMEDKGFSLVNIRASRPEVTTESGIAVPVECDLLFARDVHQVAELDDRSRLARRSIALACVYYLHDFSKQFLDERWRNTFSLERSDCTNIHLAIDTLAKFQSENLRKGALSLWHRDG